MLSFKTHTLVCLVFLQLLAGAQGVAPGIEIWGLTHKQNRILRISVEAAVKKRSSLVVTLEKGRFQSGMGWQSAQKPDVYSITGWGVRPELRFYPSKYRHAPIGTFIGPFFSFRDITETYTGYAFGFNRISLSNVKTYGTANGIGLVFGTKGNLWHFTVETKFLAMIDDVSWQYPNQRKLIDPVKARSTNQIFLGVETHIGMVFPKPDMNKIYENSVPSVMTPDPLFNDSSIVILYRPIQSAGRAAKYDVYANDSLVTRLEYAEIHELVLGDGIVWFHRNQKGFQTVTFNLEKGKTYYLKYVLGGGLIFKEPFFEVMDPIEAEKDLEKVRRYQWKKERMK